MRPFPLALTLSLFIAFASAYTFSPPIGVAYEPTYIVDLLPWQYDIMGNAQNWDIDYITSSDQSRTTLCGTTTYILGGPQMLSNHAILRRTYTQLPDHDVIYYNLNAWIIDDWGSIDSITFQFDDYISATWYPYHYLSSSLGNACGGSSNDTEMSYAGVVPHSGSTLTVTIVVDMKSVSTNNPAIGFHSLYMSFPIAGLTTESLVYSCPNGKCDYEGNICAAGQYYNGTFCSPCDASCGSCWGKKATECFYCKAGYSFNGVYCTACPTNCFQCTFSPSYTCTKCNGNYYLDIDGTCKSACGSSASTVINNALGASLYCAGPCPTGYHLYWNGSCLSSCPSPLTTTNDPAKGSSCGYPCDSTIYKYLYWDGTCQATCPYSPRIENGYRFCDACADSSQYFYQDYSCKSTCQANFTKYTVNSTKFCNFPCATSTDYLYQNGSCYSTCQPNFVVVPQQINFKLCNYPCDSSQYLYQNGTCASYCETYFNTHIEIYNFKFCTFPCQSGYFLYGNGTCASYCETGFTERVQQFGLQYCDFPCTSTQYLYQNGSCLSYCQQYFIPVTEGTNFNFCYYPCADAEYLYQNGSCMASCQADFLETVQENRFRFCSYPCSKYEYLYQNGTCLSTCQTYFNVRTENTDYKYKFCDYPCSGTEYLYQNGSCLSNCQNDFVVLSEQNKFFYCNYPCLVTQYLYQNTSCGDYCETGYLVRTEQTDFKFCDYPCVNNYSLYQNGSCLQTCETRFIQRVELTTMLFCDFPCSSSQYLYTDSTCRSTCLAGYHSVTESAGTRFCYPDCAPGYFYYQNGSCLSTCKTGYIERYEGQSYWFCDEACSSPFWMYQNGSCLATCQTYFVQRTEAGPSYFCDFPCSAGEYLYDNGLCSASCPAYYSSVIQQGNLHFCTYPCNSGDYYNQDGTCTPICSSSFEFSDGSNNFCWTCPPVGYYYYPEQGICSTDCPYPYTVQAHSNCAITQTPTDLENSKGLSKLINVSTQLVTVSASFLTFFIWSNPSSFLLLALLKMFYYMKHMKVPYSALLQSVLDRLHIEYTYTMFKGSATDSLSENTPIGHLPFNFLKYNMHSSFFVNFFTPFVWLGIISVFIGLIYLCKYCYRKDKASQVLIDKFKNLLQWNFVLAWFFDLYDGVIIYSSLTWRATTWDSGRSVWSFLLAIFFFVLVFAILGKSIQIVLQLHKVLHSTHRKNLLEKLVQDFRAKTASYQLIYGEAKGESIFTIMLFPVYIVRIILFHVIIGYLFDHPRAQTPLLLVVNAAMLFYLIKFKPLQEKRKQIQYVAFESVLFLNYLLVFVLSLPLGSSGPSESTRTALGYIIVFLYVLTVLTVLLYLFIQCAAKSIELLGSFKTYQNNRRSRLEEESNSNNAYAQDPEFQDYYHPGDKRGENEYFETSDIYAHPGRRLQGRELDNMDEFDRTIDNGRAVNRAREKAAKIHGSNKREPGHVTWK